MKIVSLPEVISALEISFLFLSVFGALLISLTSTSRAYRLLSIAILTISPFSCQYLFQIDSEFIFYVIFFIGLLTWPLLYKFIEFITIRNSNIKVRDIKHLSWSIVSPFIVYLDLQLGPENNIQIFFRLFQMLFYAALIFIIIEKHEKKLGNYFSDIESRKLMFLKICIFLLILPWLATSISQAAALISGGSLWAENSIVFLTKDLFNVISLSAFIIFVVIKKELIESHITENENCGNGKTDTKYQEKEQSEKELAEKLDKLMKDNEIFLDPDLTLTKLSRMAGINRNRLSRLLNNTLDCTFFEYVNRFRIEEVKRKLLDTENNEKTILEIAFLSGFKSKTTFNTLFKKKTGKTPTEFRNSFISNN